MPREQQRARSIAMEPGELDAFLAEQRTCRVATVLGDGAPHVNPLWFVWDGAALWLWSITRSQRWTNLERDPRVSVVVDAGEDYGELRGVELLGSVEPVGEIPRTGLQNAEVALVERLWARKYHGADTMPYDGRHAWLRLSPDKIVSWDFRKLPEERRRLPDG